MTDFSFTPMIHNVPSTPGTEFEQGNGLGSEFTFGQNKVNKTRIGKGLDQKLGTADSGIPLTPVLCTFGDENPGVHNKGLQTTSPGSKQRFQQWLAATEATFFSPKPLAAFEPGHKQPSADVRDQGGAGAAVDDVSGTGLGQRQAQLPVSWYMRTPAPSTQQAEAGVADQSSPEGSESEEDDQQEDYGSERSPSLAPAATPSTEGSKSPYSDMAVSNCLKSLSRLRFGSGEEDGMQVSPAPYPRHEPETPLLINVSLAAGGATPSLAPMQLHFGQHEAELQQEPHFTPQHGSRPEAADVHDQILTPIDDVIDQMLHSPAPCM